MDREKGILAEKPAAWAVTGWQSLVFLCPCGHNLPMTRQSKKLEWVASSHKDLKAMPEAVQDTFGYALYLAQVGEKHDQAKTLKGFGSADVQEIIENDGGGTYRAVYTVQFVNAVYVLHCFQKKSTHGIATPKPDMDLIRARLKAAELHAKGETK
jgi:phage-related protein